MAFVPNSGVVSTDIISDVFGLGDDFNNYRGVQWYYPGNLVNGKFSSGTIKSSDFYGKQPNDPATAGVLWSNTAGSNSFVVPLYRNTITIEIWGAGGGGGGANGSDGAKGGDTSVISYQLPSGGTNIADYTAGGGKGGENGTVPTPPPPLSVDVSNRGPNDNLQSFGVQNSRGGTTYFFTRDNVPVGYTETAQPDGYGGVVDRFGDTGVY